MKRKTETIWLDEVDSTNLFAIDNLDCFEHGTLIAASVQSAGRGSKGRHWISPPGINVYASVILKEVPFPIHKASWIGSLAVLEVLQKRAPRLEFSVKWPNDVLCGGVKIAGILCESVKDSLVIGIGVNVDMTPDQLSRIDKPATSLYAETGVCSGDIQEIAREIRNTVMALYQKTLSDGIDQLHQAWCAENYLAGRHVLLQLPDNQRITGQVIDFSVNGELIVVEDGTCMIREILSCDILSSEKQPG